MMALAVAVVNLKFEFNLKSTEAASYGGTAAGSGTRVRLRARVGDPGVGT